MGLLIDEQKARAAIALSGSDTKTFTDARTKQANLERQLAQGVADFELQQKDLSASGRLLIEEKLAEDLKTIDFKRRNDIIDTEAAIRQTIINESEKTSKELGAKEEAEELKRRQKRIDDLRKSQEIIQRSISEAASRQLLEEAQRYEEGVINKQQYELRKLQIENESRRKSIEAEIAYYSALATLADLPVDLQIEADKKLFELRQKLRELDTQNAEKNAEKQKDIELKKNEALKGLATELSGLTFDIFTAAIDRQRNAIQDQIDLLEQQKQKDIEVANQTIANATDRAAAIAVIEARAQAKREEMERRQRQLAQQRARFERAQNIANIIQSTAIAVVGALGAKPWTPANIALAAIVGAIGAAQIARVLATPIPKYKDGTEDHPGGYAMLGDGGKQEPFQTPDGKVGLSPAVPTIYDLPAGTKVWSSMDDYARSVHKDVPVFSNTTTTDMRPVVGAVLQNGKMIVKAIKKIPRTTVKGAGNWQTYISTGNNQTTWINKNI